MAMQDIWLRARRVPAEVAGAATLIGDLVTALDGAREDALEACAVVRTLALAGVASPVLAGLRDEANPDAPHAELIAATARQLSREVEDVGDVANACAEAWAAREHTIWDAMSTPELIAAACRQRRIPPEVRAAVVARLRDVEACAEIHAELRSALRAKPARDVRNGLIRVQRLASAGIVLDLVSDVERLLTRGSKTNREAASSGLDAMVDAAPRWQGAVDDALAALGAATEVPAAERSFEQRRVVRAVFDAARAGKLTGRVDEALARAHPEAVMAHVVATGDVDAFFLLRETRSPGWERDGLVMKGHRMLGGVRDPDSLPVLFPRLAERDVDELGELSRSTVALVFLLGPSQDLGPGTAFLAERARDATPYALPGTWMAWTGAKTKWSEVAIRALGRAAESEAHGAAARAALEALLGERKSLSMFAARVLAVAAAVRGDLAALEALVSHRKAAVREGALWGIAHGRAWQAAELAGHRDIGLVAPRVPAALIRPLTEDRSASVAELAVLALQKAGACAHELPTPPFAEVIRDLRSESFNAVAQGQDRVLAWVKRGYRGEALAPIVPALVDSISVKQGGGKVFAALARAGTDVSMAVPALAGVMFARPVPRFEVEALVEIARRTDTSIADPWVHGHLAFPERVIDHQIAALRYLEVRAGQGAELPPLPRRCLEDDRLAAIAACISGPESTS